MPVLLAAMYELRAWLRPESMLPSTCPRCGTAPYLQPYMSTGRGWAGSGGKPHWSVLCKCFDDAPSQRTRSAAIAIWTAAHKERHEEKAMSYPDENHLGYPPDVEGMREDLQSASERGDDLLMHLDGAIRAAEELNRHYLGKHQEIDVDELKSARAQAKQNIDWRRNELTGAISEATGEDLTSEARRDYYAGQGVRRVA